MENLTTDIRDVTGVTISVGAVTLNIWEMITSVPINGWFIIATSIGGLIYIYWKVKTQKKRAKLLDLEIEQKQLEINKLKEKK